MSLLKVVLFGSTGLVGQELSSQLKAAGHVVRGVARRNADICLDASDRHGVKALLSREEPDVMINCIALVDVEKCESDHHAAWALNVAPVFPMVDWSNERNVPLVQISTDQFYDGDGRKKHREDDPIVLLNNYAKTKFVAEQLCLSIDQGLVIRTAMVGWRGWPYPTLAEWAYDAIINNKQVKLFADSLTSAIDVRSLGTCVLDLVTAKQKGLVNIGSRDVYSKAEFLLEMSAQLNRPLNFPRLGSLRDLPTMRGDSLGLDCSKIEAILVRQMPSLGDVVASVLDQRNMRKI